MHAKQKPSSPFDHKYFRTVFLSGSLTVAVIALLAHRWMDESALKDFPWSVAGGFLAGEIGLITYLFSRRQQQAQFENQLLNDQFIDIQNRFTDPDIKTRAGAAVRLAEIARSLRPGRIEKATGSRERYPYFLSAASQLAVALQTESEDAVRDTLLQSVLSLGDFARSVSETEGDEALHVDLLEKLADANRAALRAFCKALAEYDVFVEYEVRAVQGEREAEERMARLDPVAPFCKEAGLNRVCLYHLRQSEESRRDYALFVSLRQAQNKGETGGAEGWLLDRVRLAAVRLLASRDALASALRAPVVEEPRRPTERLRMQAVQKAGVEATPRRVVPGQANIMRKRTRERTLNLSDCLLAGADLREAQLQEATLTGAQLHGANLTGAQMQGADLLGAQLQGATLTRCKIGGINYEQSVAADYLCANFRGADWASADFRHPAHVSEDIRLKQWLERNFPRAQELPVEARYPHFQQEEPPIERNFRQYES
jgi:hypothetical protein